MNLVENLPEESSSSTASDEFGSEPPVLLWTGDDVALWERACAALDDSKIPYKDEELRFGLLREAAPPLYKIWIHRRDQSAAREVLDEVLRESKEADQKIEAEAANSEMATDHDDDASSEATAEYVSDDFDPEAATSEVWAGEDAEMAQNLKACLQEVGIGSVIGESQGKTHVRVLPSSEARAREIVREIIEASPPE